MTRNMKTISAAHLRKDLVFSIENVIERNESLVVKTEKGNVVILSENEYSALNETIRLLSQPDFLESIKKGERESISDMAIYDSGEEW